MRPRFLETFSLCRVGKVGKIWGVAATLRCSPMNLSRSLFPLLVFALALVPVACAIGRV